jgi:hypothetical protein
VQRDSNVRGFWAFGFLLALVLTLPGCASSGKHRPAATPLETASPMLSAEYVFGPVRGDAQLELEDLAKVYSNPARLRRAYILLQQGHPDQAIDATAEVIYAAERPSPNEEAYARYLRAEASQQLGKGDLGAFDRARARELAVDPELQRRLASQPVETKPAPVHGAGALAMPVLHRVEWRPMSPVASRLDPMTKIYRLTIHHSAMWFRDDSQAAAAAAIQQIQHNHILQMHWADIGYHFLIDPAGRVWEGRPLRWQGAHAEGENNIGNIGVCLLGNFVRARGGQRPTDAQVQALRQLTSQLCEQYSIGVDQVWMHKQFKSTECPGELMEGVVAQLKRDMKTGHLAGPVAARE